MQRRSYDVILAIIGKYRYKKAITGTYVFINDKIYQKLWLLFALDLKCRRK